METILDPADVKQEMSPAVGAYARRAELNKRFQALQEILPKPPPGREVKHKVQILDYLCDIIESLEHQNACLELEFARNCVKLGIRWVDRVVMDAPDEKETVCRLMRELHQLKRYVYAECLEVMTKSILVTRDAMQREGVETQGMLAAFQCNRELGTPFEPEGFIRDAINSLKPTRKVVLNNLFPLDEKHAWTNKHNIQAAMAFPIIVEGKCKYLAVFYDNSCESISDAEISKTAPLTRLLGDSLSNCRASSKWNDASQSDANYSHSKRHEAEPSPPKKPRHT
uniref:BHLH domain-containing protein n=1 Tax=Compsopogon caeruleus TaxID=31354 RepID=A0A7S1TIQ7_9RHOD|mmetsp:Transcript_6113/g.11947  ORF Transcript_6113/g.11947 Transcript_6113/m.11947 type:complete len:283 (+) Transcript_6113:311-1159(+)|eukprot:CAMPEP_0184685670 /NCGR_PEP_ID=MMETSP0312-20130426/19730_1 /TAXON_ID=31354 /ORGANISM="Compsopogon coeruleus, Strain SAG 36.94" /LENGTH=282 /DNA_ID=CAMNT_0027139973 /DNA_START=243 /DNA_END=1091 /DNA_ORIENTATION=+